MNNRIINVGGKDEEPLYVLAGVDNVLSRSLDGTSTNLDPVIDTQITNITGSSISKTGQYMLVGSNGGYSYKSNNFGSSWSTAVSQGNYSWSSTMSSSGEYQFLTAYNKYYKSNNYGSSWTTMSNISIYYNKGIVCSSSGQYVTVVTNSTRIYISSNYGETWTEKNITNSTSWRSVSMSETGQYQIACSDSLGLVISTNYGETWTQINMFTNSGWMSVAMSYSGQYIVATLNGSTSKGVYISSNFGQNWSQTSLPTSKGWTTCAISGSGKTIYASEYLGNLYKSSDFGQNWNIIYSNFKRSFQRISLSYDNSYWTITSSWNSPIYKSNNSGSSIDTIINSVNSTTNTYEYYGSYYDSTISETGQYQLIAKFQYPLESNNYGVTWSENYYNYMLANTDRSAMSGNGQYRMLGSSSSGDVYFSNNYGSTWSTLSTGSSCRAVRISSTAEYMLYVKSTEWYYSTDYGQTWNLGPNPSSSWYNDISISDNGQLVYLFYNSSWNYYSSSGITGSYNYESMPQSPTSGSMSSNGSYMLYYGNSGNLYRKTSFYGSWSQVSGVSGVSNVYVSKDGQYQFYVSGNYLYKSTNYGSSWSQITTKDNNYWQSISVQR